MKKNIALVKGGFTGESVVSFNSAQQVSDNLNRDLYHVYEIVIIDSNWFCEVDGEKFFINKNDFTLEINHQIIKFDVAFIIIHGSPGEDGKLQSYFDLLNIPYTSCNASTSAITMNKAYTKALVQDINDLHIAKSVKIFKRDEDAEEQIKNTLKLPIFIKPNNGGSSIGMSKVNNWDALPSALKKAFAEDEQILVEEFIKGREFTVGIYKNEAAVQVLPITEIKSSKEFFDYEAKYTTGVSEEITPAVLEFSKTEQIGKIVSKVYQQLDCKGVVRVDFILQEDTDDFYFIEINTVPGQSQNSIIPQQVRAIGLKMSDFYSMLIERALIN